MAPIELRFTSRSGDPGLEVTIEPRPGGRIYERTPAGGDATTVTIVHRGWERLGGRRPDLRRRNVQGWDGLRPPLPSV
jgi:hypothetical protein